ncbi:MAG: GNAT family N-acetyltransferase [Phenylobacterium sp.]|uniref:GNAT family N-acetyltransferase n=1 Tax=Phenylobacterium sp. TaxID=1871053 RepID=UPI003919635F
MSYVVFPAGPDDALDLARLHVASWRETYRGLLPEDYLAAMSPEAQARRFYTALMQPEPTDATLVAANRAGLVGYASGGRSRQGLPGEAEIATLYVLRAAQGRGLGRRLVQGLARVFAANGAASLTISVLRDNLPARRFYEHLGGLPDVPRREPGPGGVVAEVSYRWPDIRDLVS